MLDSNTRRMVKVAITTGDPAGVGPEVVLRAVDDPSVRDVCEPVIVGNAARIDDLATRLEIDLQGVRVVDVDCAAGLVDPNSAAGGEFVIRSLRTAVDLACSKAVDALATAPASKAGLRAAGARGVGQTALIRAFAGIDDTVMMLGHGSVRTAHITDHVPLREVFDLLTRERVQRVLRLTNDGLLRFGVQCPRLAVAGINPHAGESGVLGREETEILVPAIEWANEHGLDVCGPFPNETVWARAQDFDVVIVAYHDAGHVPLRMLAHNRGLHFTLGLPFPRVAPLHGCAFGHAGGGTADHSAMRAAIMSAAELSHRRDSI